jgi:hypothetical protein
LPANVEALIAFEATSREAGRLIPETKPMPPAQKVTIGSLDDEPPAALPFALFVAYDWLARAYRVRLEDVRRCTNFRLELPGQASRSIEPGVAEFSTELGPQKSKEYAVAYREQSADGQTSIDRVAHGLITEIALDSSTHVYTPTLKIDEFFSSWMLDRDYVYGRLAMATPDLEDEQGGSLPGAVDVPVDQLDATNLFSFYRSLKELEDERLKPAADKGDARTVREYLVARPDSLYQLALLLAKQATNPGVRLALLLECDRMFERWGRHLRGDGAIREQVRTVAGAARDAVRDELVAMPRVGRSANETLQWFEAKLREAWK